MVESLFVELKIKYPQGPQLSVSETIPASPHSITAIFGQSGSGKTTLLHCIAGLAMPDSGVIRFQGDIWFDSKKGISRSPQLRKVGYVSQSSSLFPHLSVYKNILYGLSHLSTQQAKREADEKIELLQLRGLENRSPSELSGGQKQIVALARTLVTQPRLLLLDEPFSSLDAQTQEWTRKSLQLILKRLRIPVLFVTHDSKDLWALAQRIILVSGGHVLESGSLEHVYQYPKSVPAARALGVENFVSGKVISKEGSRIEIEVGDKKLLAISKMPIELGTQVTACIRAEFVGFSMSQGQEASNYYPGIVLEMVREGSTLLVKLDCGFLLTARCLVQDSQSLRLNSGAHVVVGISAENVHFFENSGRLSQ